MKLLQIMSLIRQYAGNKTHYSTYIFTDSPWFIFCVRSLTLKPLEIFLQNLIQV